MQHRNTQREAGPRYPGLLTAIAIALVLALPACGGKESGAPKNGLKRTDASPATGPRIVACALLPKEEMNAITGEAYTAAESSDDGHSSETSCHYSTAANPAGMSLSIDWINPRDYSDPAEHAALQRAAIGGARLGGKLMAATAGASIPGVPSGPVEGLGDEATFNMLLLTARRGDYTIMVQIVPSDMISLMMDSTVAIRVVEKEKAVVRKVLEKL